MEISQFLGMQWCVDTRGPLFDWGIEVKNVAPNEVGSGVGRLLRNFLFFAVPPSNPLCSQSGQTSVGGSTALRCSSSEGAPKPVYKWVRLGSFPTPSPGSMVQGKGPGHQEEGTGDLGKSASSLASCMIPSCLSSCTVCGWVILGVFLKLNILLISWKKGEGREHSVDAHPSAMGRFLLGFLRVMDHFQTS